MPHHRKRRRIFVLSLWILLLVVIIGAVTPVRDIVLTHFFPSARTSSTPIPSGDNLFYIQAIPKGSIFIDERQITHLPVIGKDHPLQLSPGKHQIRWEAAPFKPLSCIVSVPSSLANDQCPYESVTPLTPAENVRLVTFDPSIANLPTAQRTALVHQIQLALNTLQSTTIVQPGESYLSTSPSGLPSMVTATQQLQAALSFHLDTDPTTNRSCEEYNETCTSPGGQNCVLLCVLPDTTFVPNSPSSHPQPLATLTWEIVGLFYPTWTYTTTGGQVVAMNQPDALPDRVVGEDHSVLAHTTWDRTGWHAVIITPNSDWHATSTADGSPTNFGFADPACGSLNDLINGTTTYLITQRDGTVTWKLKAGTDHADGCVGVVTPDAANLPVAYCLYRFGVLLAANAAAHRYFPTLSVADANEQTVAQQIANEAGV